MGAYRRTEGLLGLAVRVCLVAVRSAARHPFAAAAVGFTLVVVSR